LSRPRSSIQSRRNCDSGLAMSMLIRGRIGGGNVVAILPLSPCSHERELGKIFLTAGNYANSVLRAERNWKKMLEKAKVRN